MADTLNISVTDHFLEYGKRSSLELFNQFEVLLVSADTGGVTLTVCETSDQTKMEFWFHVVQAPFVMDNPTWRKWWMIGSAMGVMGSLHVFYEIPTEGKR
jgi:hypothetical protein